MPLFAYAQRSANQHTVDTCTHLFITGLFTIASYGIHPGAYKEVNGLKKKSGVYATWSIIQP
jgi:hypothetical protein